MQLWTVLDWVARIMFSVFFAMSGIAHLTNPALVGYAKSKNVPAVGVYATGLMLLAGAVSIVTGWHPDWGALLLVGFLVPTAFIMHNFWTHSDPMMKANDQAHFWKDITLAAGALLYIVMLHRGGMAS